MPKKINKNHFFLLKKKTYKVVKAYRMIHLNMDMMKNEMKVLVMMLNNQMMNNQNHKEINLVLVMLDTYMMIEIVALLFVDKK